MSRDLDLSGPVGCVSATHHSRTVRRGDAPYGTQSWSTPGSPLALRQAESWPRCEASWLVIRCVTRTPTVGIHRFTNSSGTSCGRGHRRWVGLGCGAGDVFMSFGQRVEQFRLARIGRAIGLQGRAGSEFRHPALGAMRRLAEEAEGQVGADGQMSQDPGGVIHPRDRLGRELIVVDPVDELAGVVEQERIKRGLVVEQDSAPVSGRGDGRPRHDLRIVIARRAARNPRPAKARSPGVTETGRPPARPSPRSRPGIGRASRRRPPGRSPRSPGR